MVPPSKLETRFFISNCFSEEIKSAFKFSISNLSLTLKSFKLIFSFKLFVNNSDVSKVVPVKINLFSLVCLSGLSGVWLAGFSVSVGKKTLRTDRTAGQKP